MTHRFILTVAALLTFSVSAYAADDFGPRFANQTLAGFTNPAPTTPPSEVNEFMADMNDLATQLQNIMPAAGDEPTKNPTEPPATSAPVQNKN